MFKEIFIGGSERGLQMKKRLLTLILTTVIFISMLAGNIIVVSAEYNSETTYSIYRSLTLDKLKAPSYAVLEFGNGQVLLEKNANEVRPIADLTKLMTFYIIFENVKLGNIAKTDTITATANSVSPGGNTAFIYAGEKFSLESGLKAAIINNCNDVTIAIAENIVESEAAFVVKMNEKAKELNMTNTTFVDCTGISADNKSTAMDMAILSRALILEHPDYLDYSIIWMDTFRDSKFNLYNTNRLLRFMPQSEGLKYAHSTSALYNLSSTYKEDDRRVISVALGVPDENQIVAESRFLLENAIDNYMTTEVVNDGEYVKDVKVKKGVEKAVRAIISGSKKVIIDVNDKEKIEEVADVYESVEAPVTKGDKLGSVTYKLNGKVIAVVDIVAENDVKKANWFQRLIQWILEWFGLA